MSEAIADANPFDEKVILDSMPQPVLAVGNDRRVRYANLSAQVFGRSGRPAKSILLTCCPLAACLSA